jgi:alcohol dehydrogenase
MRTGNDNVFTFYLPTKVVHGAHSVKETGKELRALGTTKALVVTDKGVKDAGLVESVLESLQTSGITCLVFDEVEEDPGGTTVAKGADLASREKCDGIVVIGGGSPICAARGMGVVATNGGRIKDYVGINKAVNPPLPLIAIPTTAGSGTEVSQFIVLKDEELHTKMVAGSPMYFPRVAILDPLLLTKLPYWQFVVSGVDALCHAIDGYWTTMATSITDALALQAVELLYRNLRAAATTDDLDAKEACLIGSTMANMACGNAKLGLVHLMTNPMEGMFKVPHGIAVGTLIPYVAEFNLPAAHQRFVSLAKAMGETASGRSVAESAASAITALKRLFNDLGFPRKYSEAQIDPKAIPQMATMVMGGMYSLYDPAKQHRMSEPVPTFNIRKTTLGEMISLYERAFKGWEL